jgi:Concanavalin A-like lectin/glucanases superfamily
MGILRVNKVSGLEAPTPVTGSVGFDGSGDYLSIPQTSDLDFGFGDFTIELWIYFNSFNFDLDNIVMGGSGSSRFGLYLDSTIRLSFVSQAVVAVNLSQANALSTGTWNHIAVVRKNAVLYGYINGFQTGSLAFNYTLPNGGIGIGAQIDGSAPIDGYISNLRVLKGTALYTANFTPPVNELQPIGDTVLLCCNNSTSATAEATGKTITANGNAVASTFSPGLTRDFTYGTQFSGVTRFDTQGYFVPPSGNTQNRYTLGLDEIVTSGLVLHLDAGNPFSYPATGVGTKWTDLSGNNNHGTLVNGVSYTENNRGALSFDGSDDYVTLSSSQIAPGTGAFTWNFWAKSTRTQQNYSILFSGAGSNADYGVIGLNQQVGYGLLYYAGGYRIQDADISFFGNWIYVSFIGNGGGTGSRTLRLYKNGVQAGSTYTFDYNFTSTTPIIGANHSAFGECMGGNIANITYYNRALSAAEVSQNFNALRGRYGI